jgi:hypothetical protein
VELISRLFQVLRTPAGTTARILALGFFLMSLMSPAVALAEDDAAEPMPITPGKKWTVLHQTPAKATNLIVRLPEKGPLFPLNDLELTGPRKDPVLLSEFKSEAEWGADRSGLFVTKGKDAALLLAEAEDFELEGTMQAEGLGGWFFVVGWKDSTPFPRLFRHILPPR